MEKKNTGMTLYDITNSFVELMSKAEDGELTEEEYNKLGEELATELQNKSASIIGYIINQEALVEAIGVQEERLSDLKKSKKNNIDNFKKYVKENMEKLGVQKIETELGTLSIQKSPMSVEIVDSDLIPNEYKKIVQSINIDKTGIKKNFKENGKEIPGVKIISDKTYLKVK